LHFRPESLFKTLAGVDLFDVRGADLRVRPALMMHTRKVSMEFNVNRLRLGGKGIFLADTETPPVPAGGVEKTSLR
jgi:hypothetical protein